MSSNVETTQTVLAESIPTLKLVGGSSDDVPQWINELRTRGWTVVPKAIPKERALHYANEAYNWLESWNQGYSRHDSSTRTAKHLPYTHRAGIFARYGIAHEQFVWDLKSEPGLVEKFEQIWGTKELLVSYDGLNLSVPENGRPKTDPAFAPWAHVDQSPLRSNLQCIQGILNLLPNGPEDGGLMVFDGSNRLYEELWEHFDHKKGEKGWNTWEQQFLDEEMCAWLESKGCKWVKVCAGPGDLLLWDSRCVHYGATPSSTNDRFAAYVCYKPTALVSDQAKKQREEAWALKENTPHDPAILRRLQRDPPEDHPTYEQYKARGLQEPVLSKRGKQLAGLAPY
ncbi:hypothetical protein PFICI_12194 [Pestalotiopsis fici W106-1]|uniref:Phytanoyl-CoA dioxygenase n=1 Tax=Pestalotiopsis fici (strain W106-1 / CGMCC3.15140) TaxID=1229662 RepID=W3WUL6_PESFW|nr:uncharacterized protein PFICI_12194 [Pestalotiopsis fici W106-1]ETS76807.1 hypothetical protein PFICI_12194 [Pestalotiopsis fici W106-1]